MTALTQALQHLGWHDGRNFQIDTGRTGGDAALTRQYATKLVTLSPDAILAVGAANTASSQQATGTVPIVFVLLPDPVGAGVVANLSRPGGNTTGFTPYEYGISGKWLELLKEIAPRVTQVAIYLGLRRRDRGLPSLLQFKPWRRR